MRRNMELKRLARVLHRKREEISKSLSFTRTEMNCPLDREVGDQVDRAVDAECHEVSSHLAEVESHELQHIDAALERIANGTYGTCSFCSRSIPLARLRALPFATECVQCARLVEEKAMPPNVLLEGEPNGTPNGEASSPST